MFIVAHFLSVFIYDSFVVDDELLNGSGVDLRALQASIYVIIPMMILSKELKLIIIYLLGRDSAIRIFNIVFDYYRLNNKTRLFRRRTNNNSVCNINLSICYENIKNAKWCK